MAKKKVVAKGTIIQLCDRMVRPELAQEAVVCCKHCCFGFEGRAQRDCPSVNGTHLCTLIYIDGMNSIYFREIK